MLDSYRVLDLCDDGSLICGQILGDLGADVVVIEPPGGAHARQLGPYYHDEQDPERSLNWWSWNRNKRGITLDIEDPDDQERLKRLVRSADFLLESYAPGYLDSLGLGYEALAELNPALVMVSMTAFGQKGPKANWANSDLTAYASSGAMILSGDPDRAPLSLAIPQAFLHAGAEGAVGALIAHFERKQSGLGQHVDVSAQTATMMATQGAALSFGAGELPAQRVAGGVNFGGMPIKFIHPASDGHVSVTFLFGSSLGPFTVRLMEVMYERGFVDEATRDKDWLNYSNLLLSGEEPMSELERCVNLVSKFTSAHTKQELFELGLERQLLIVPVATVDEVAGSEQLAARNFWRKIEHPAVDDNITYPGPFVKTDVELEYRRPAPQLGEHNPEILNEVERAPLTSLPASSQRERRAPLEGVRVLDFMWVVAGPSSTRYFADYGATVVKVESVEHIDMLRTVGPLKDHIPGPERSVAYATINAGKRGLTLNLSDPRGREVAMKLAEWADVVTESFAPGAIGRLGLDYESIKEVNPDIIMLSSSLNGQTGPLSKLSGIGTMGMHIAGFGELAGWPDRAPAGPAGAYTDYIVPKYTAAIILAALDRRDRTGEGMYIDLAHSETAQQFLAPALLDYFVNDRVIARRGNRSPEHAPHAVYPASGDDLWAAIAVLNDEQWQGLCRALERSDWANDASLATAEGRLKCSDDLDAAIAAWTADRTLDDIEKTLQAQGVPVHRVSSSEDLWSDPQIEARGHFVTLPHPECETMPVEASRMVFSHTPAQITRPGPTFGQDNEYILKEVLGYSDDEFIELLAAGILE